MQQKTGTQRRKQIIACAKFLAPIALSLLGARYPKASAIGGVGLGLLEASTTNDEAGGASDVSRRTERR